MIVPAPERNPEYRAELLGFIQEAMNRHPRGSQNMVGPSEIGGCQRGLAWKLHFGASDGKQQGWSAGKGVVMHDWVDREVFSKLDSRFKSDLKLPQLVPWVAGGTLDLYDSAPPPTVVDFKFPGDPSMEKARRGKPPWAYYVQVNTYGLGLIKQGYPVERVALLYLPMGGDDLHGDTKGASLLTWPFDPKVAVEHLKLVKRIQDDLAQRSLYDVMSDLPTQEDFCHSRQCWRGNRHPDAHCMGHRKGGAPMATPGDIFG